MSTKNELRVPAWNRRRWLLFKKSISQPNVIEAVARYQREYLSNGSKAVPMYAYFDMIQNYLPDGCGKAYEALLSTPGITDQELVDLIEPPIKIISHVHKHIGLTDNPNIAYERYMHKIGADELPDDVDELYEEDTGLYLRIAPHTRPSEITAFISKYYDKEMWPHLQEQPIWDTKKSTYMNERHTKTRQAVADNELIKNRILALKHEGKKAPEISRIIEDEFDKYVEPTYIRKIISLAR